MSAFLYFSQIKRKELKEKFPDLKNTEISTKLGEMWRAASYEEREPHIVREREQREIYKEKMGQWRKEQAEKQAKEDAERKTEAKAQMDQLVNVPPMNFPAQQPVGGSSIQPHQQMMPPDPHLPWGYPPPPGYGPPPTYPPMYGMYGKCRV
jgi:hypothetical protein